MKNLKKTKIFYFVSNFSFWGLHELWYLSVDLEYAWHCGETWIVCIAQLSAFFFEINMILYEYVLVCTFTQGLIKKLIFLVCVASIA